MVMQLLTRDEFRVGVFERDGYKCVMCGAPGLDAHHIMERRLWGDSGGYYLDNGVTVCGACHFKAERTSITPDELREAAGIKHRVLPEHMYDDPSIEYDKWGNIVLPTGQRIRGELFYDESVQKVLAQGGVLDRFSKYVKHPRTHHLPWSGGVQDDDRVLETTGCFDGREVVVSVKMDGEQTTMYNDYVHARSLDGEHHVSRNWVKQLHSQIGYQIPDGWRVSGENVYALHTIAYDNLPTFFFVHSIWNEVNVCLSYDETCEWAELLGLRMVPAIYRGVWDEEHIKRLYRPIYDGNEMEGYVVRVTDSFTYGQFRESVAKYVNPEFKQRVNASGHNWRMKPVVPNKLSE